MKNDLVIIGLVLIIVGVFFFWFFCLGALIAIVGLIVLVMGLTQEDESRPRAPTIIEHRYVGSPPYGTAGWYCQNCGSLNVADANFCGKCGQPKR